MHLCFSTIVKNEAERTYVLPSTQARRQLELSSTQQVFVCSVLCLSVFSFFLWRVPPSVTFALSAVLSLLFETPENFHVPNGIGPSRPWKSYWMLYGIIISVPILYSSLA